MIGGREQRGKWKLDARFNKVGLRERIERIALYRQRITLSNLDALDFLTSRIRQQQNRRVFVYLDPPYFNKGRELYLDYYEPADHKNLARYLAGPSSFSWVLTYDNEPMIRKLYRANQRYAFNLSYSARERRIGKELLVVDTSLKVPSDWQSRVPDHYFLATA